VKGAQSNARERGGEDGTGRGDRCSTCVGEIGGGGGGPGKLGFFQRSNNTHVEI